MKSYRDLNAWREACDLAQTVYEGTARFPQHERFGLTSQARRAAVSVPSNIAEGAGRGQPREFARFVRIAAGSLSELRTLLELARRFRYITDDEAAALDGRADAIARKLYGLLRSLEAAAAARG